MTAWVHEDFRRPPPPRSGASAGRKRWPARDFRVRGGSCAHGERRHYATSDRKWRRARGERYAPATLLSRRTARHRPIRGRGGARGATISHAATSAGAPALSRKAPSAPDPIPVRDDAPMPFAVERPGRRERAGLHDLPHEGWEAGRPVVPARRRPDLRCAGGGVAHLGRAGSTATGPPVHGRGMARVGPRACSRRWIPVRGRGCGRFRSGVSHPSTPVDNPGDRRWTSRVRGVDHSDPAGDTRGRLLVLSTGTASSPQNYTSVSPHPQPPG